MERDAYAALVAWKNSPDRKPMVIRGVRQCGKTYLMKDFGRREFDDCAYFNLENDDALQSVFRGRRIEQIIAGLSAIHGSPLGPRTLLVIDEIQFSAAALTSLKYFYESRPDIPVLCAGSLLGIKLSKNRRYGDAELSFPVGKVSFIDLRPMTFGEFVRARDGALMADARRDPDGAMGQALAEAMREYLAFGGMPEAVETWLSSRDADRTDKVLRDLSESYEMDYRRYAPPKDLERISAVWSSVPFQIAKDNKRFLFGHAVKGARAKDLEDALQWLLDAGFLHKVRLTHSPSLPLGSDEDGSKFRLYYSDVGMMRQRMGIPPAAVLTDFPRLSDEFRGALAENLVLTELVAAAGKAPFYWQNADGRAEVDFLLQEGADVFPIEVKSGKVGRLQSLEVYMERYSPKKAFVVSHESRDKEAVDFVPLWSVDSIPSRCLRVEEETRLKGI